MNELTILIAFILVTTGCSILARSFECHAKASALGYSASYAPFQGCVLIKKDGTKVLLEQLRDFSGN